MELDAGADSHWKTRAVLRAQPPPEYSSPGLPVSNQTSYTIFDELFKPQAFTHALDMSAYAAKFFNACTRVQGNVHNSFLPCRDLGMKASFESVYLLGDVPGQTVLLHQPLAVLPHYDVQEGVPEGSKDRRGGHGEAGHQTVSKSRAPRP